MKCFLMLLGLCVFTWGQQIKVDFSKNPFLQEPHHWSTKGDTPWKWQKGYLQSGAIKDNQANALLLKLPTNKGLVTFTYGISSEVKGDYLFFSVNGKNMFGDYGVGQRKYSIRVEKGQNILKWVYNKDGAHKTGNDCVWLYNLSYPAPDITFSKIDFSDRETPYSFGNSDHIINNFETIQITTTIKNNANYEYKGISVAPILSDHEEVSLLIKPTPKTLDIKPKKEGVIRFSITVGRNFNKNKLVFPIAIKMGRKTLNDCLFSAPFAQIDFAKRYLQQAKAIKVEKFNYQNKQSLDAFLTKYPNSKYAPVLFRMRLEVCRQFRTAILSDASANVKEREKNLIKAINEYNEFIEKYPNRLLTKVAIHECFQLYSKINRISYYYNFIKRYPFSQHSLVAKELIKGLFFSFICTQNTIDGYEKFLYLYPEPSFFRQKCIQLAIAKAISKEQKISANLKTVQQRNQRANELIKQILQIRKEYRQLSVQKRIKKAIHDTRIERIKEVIIAIYTDTYAINTVLLLEDLRDLAELNQHIDKKLTLNHQKTIDTLNAHFTALKKEFKAVNLQLQTLNQNLQIMYKNIEERFDKVDAKLEQLDKNMQKGFAGIETKLDTSFKELMSYYALLYYNLEHVNKKLANIDAGVTYLSEDSKQFLYKQTEMMALIERGNKVYTGYHHAKPNGFKTAISGTVANIIKSGVKLIPVVGPIMAEQGSPIIDWMGKKVTNKAIVLWEKIF